MESINEDSVWRWESRGNLGIDKLEGMKEENLAVAYYD